MCVCVATIHCCISVISVITSLCHMCGGYLSAQLTEMIPDLSFMKAAWFGQRSV